MSGYIGPIPVPQGIQNKETFTATAGQTTFNTNGYTDGAFISVYLNGVRLINGTDYTATNGSDVVLASAAAASDVVDFESFNSFSLASQQFENITTKNPTHEDTDGGRESAISFQGEQSGGEISTLAAIQASHDGTADDQKGDLIFKTNDGSDNAAPTEALRIGSDQRLFMTRGDTLAEISMDANRSGASQSIGRFNYFWNGTQVAKIEALAGSDTTNKDDGELRFQTRESGSALAERWRITKEGHFKAMSNGLGIDFSATEGSGASSSILDDYEEGSFNATIECGTSGTISLANGGNAVFYTKIGNIVTMGARLDVASVSSPAGQLFISSLPFTLDISADSAGQNCAAIGIFNPSSDTNGQLIAEMSIDNGATKLLIRDGGGKASGVTAMADHIDAGSLFTFTVTYRVA
jgi:hypothetical protein